MRILGINAYHGDASACLIVDGRLVAAAEEERFRRIKHWAGFPSEAIRYCLQEGKLALGDLDHVALNSDPKANILKRVGYVLATRPELGLVVDRIRNQAKRVSVEAEIADGFPGQKLRAQVHRVEHHLAHLASCFLVSPFAEADAVSVDGFGDFSSAAWGTGRGSTIDVIGRVFFPHSLGIFYQAITQFIGFPHYGDEYKVMGLAPYGEPKYLEEMRRIVRLHEDGGFSLDTHFFRHHREKISYEWSGGAPSVGRLFAAALEELLGPARSPDQPLETRHRDIARSAQVMYEEAFFHLLNKLQARTGSDSVTLAGGCAMNSVANGKVRRATKYRRVYVQSAAGDAGGAIGAATMVWHTLARGNGGPEHTPEARKADAPANRFVMDHAYWGPQFTNDDIAELLGLRLDDLKRAGCRAKRFTEEDALCERTAEAIAGGLVVGWFQGRMEWGPRALGNRSILSDPRRADMKNILNLKIKRRESFRPFAPSILREHVAEWFEEDDDVPFMMQVLQIRTEKREVVPAVTHVDGSGRLQTVDQGTNPRYWRLIEAFARRTGVPMVLNTSFNENEPVVCRPEEALECFLRTKMDVLVMGDWLIERQS
jgi:carbamoyltransferase